MLSLVSLDSLPVPTKLAPANASPEAKVTGPTFVEQLQKARENNDQKKLKEVCQELESVLVYQMIRCMRATVPKTDFLGNSLALGIYEQMLDEKYAQEMAKTRTFGLAELLYAQLTKPAYNAGPGTLNRYGGKQA